MADVVLLDLDRTLVDLQSFTDYDAAWDQVRDLVDPSLVPPAPVTGWSSSTRACMEVLAALPAGGLWQRVSDLVASYEWAAVDRSVPMPGVDAFVAAVADAGRAVVTLLPADVAAAVLARHQITVDVVVGRDPHVRPKPSGDGLRRALELLGAAAEAAVMVGDSTWDAAAAADAGVRFVGVNSGPGEFAAQFPEVPVCSSLSEALAYVR